MASTLRKREYLEESRTFKSAADEGRARAIGRKLDAIQQELDQAKSAYKKWMSSDRMKPQLQNVHDSLITVHSTAMGIVRKIPGME